ncbi:MAG: T9SS type A sorting domain-containing protein [Chitinophagales bacterium]|nr:T9SS type A sorting domain-containing protein [Chitinophagales bacterium]
MTQKWIAVFFVLFNTSASCQSGGMWTWMNGNNTINQPGVFGTKGVASALNTPPSFYEAADWTDLQGNFWLFGGKHIGLGTEYGDLWKYEPATNNWTWIKGPGVVNDTGSYGTMGVAAITNNPPPRSYGVATWVDLNGDLWLYGGYGLGGNFSDLWKYNIATNMWTWVHGPAGVGNLAVYGLQGVPSPANNPGNRCETDACWVDANNDLWLFGGSNGMERNDLWRYNIATDEWTWMKGADTSNQSSIYGTKGIAASNNVPGARIAYASWTDANGNFWLFGGYRHYPAYNNNDMWRYEPASNNWTWISGTNVPNSIGNYGPFCTSSVNYVPTGRFETRARWKDACGNFWLYGGAMSTSLNPSYFDLWTFNPTTFMWTRLKGSNTTNASPNYGIQGVGANSSTPGARSGACGWQSNNGDLYLFGGSSYLIHNHFNDLWKFVVEPWCAPLRGLDPVELGNDSTYCSGFTRVLKTNDSSTIWSTGAIASQITINAPGTYWASIDKGCTVITDTIRLVQSTPPIINIGADTSLCGGTNYLLNAAIPNGIYKWNNNSTTPGFNVTASGIYAVTVTEPAGCTAEAAVNVHVSETLLISTNHINTSCGNSNGTAMVSVIAGVAPYTFFWSNGDTSAATSNLPAGSYFINVSDSVGCIVTDTVMINTSSSNVPVIVSADTVLCSGDTTMLCAPQGYTSYLWNTGNTADCIKAFNAGNYYVATTDTNNCSAQSNRIAITVHPLPPVSVSVNSDTLQVYNAYTYQWLLNGVAITGATDSIYIANLSGSYTVQITDENGCIAVSGSLAFTNLFSAQNTLSEIEVFPNPNNTDVWKIHVSDNWVGAYYEIIDDLGRIIFKAKILNAKTEFIMHAAARGVYILRMCKNEKTKWVKLVRN